MPRQRYFLNSRKPAGGELTAADVRFSFDDIRKDLDERDASAGPDWRDRITFRSRGPDVEVQIANDLGFVPEEMLVVRRSALRSDAILVRADRETIVVVCDAVEGAEFTAVVR